MTSFRKYRLLPFNSTQLDNPPTILMPPDIKAISDGEKIPSQMSVPPEFQEVGNLKSASWQSHENLDNTINNEGQMNDISPKPLTIEVASSLANQFKNDKFKKAKVLLDFLQQIGLLMSSDGQVLYENSVMGSPLFELVNYLVSPDSNDSRPWDLMRFLSELKKHGPVPWAGFLSKTKNYLKDPDKIMLKRKKSLTPPPPGGVPGTSFNWQKLF